MGTLLDPLRSLLDPLGTLLDMLAVGSLIDTLMTPLDLFETLLARFLDVCTGQRILLNQYENILREAPKLFWGVIFNWSFSVYTDGA